MTRWLQDKGWRVKVQHSEEATVTTEVGVFPKYIHQTLRWCRTSWRSNLTCLFRRPDIMFKRPWSFYAIHLASVTNLAFFYDGAMLHTLRHSLKAVELPKDISKTIPVSALVCWILVIKTVKLTPHFKRHPWDLVYFPGYVVFAYYHSFQKVYSLLTCWNITWASRPGVDAPTTTKKKRRSLLDAEKRCKGTPSATASEAENN